MEIPQFLCCDILTPPTQHLCQEDACILYLTITKKVNVKDIELQQRQVDVIAQDLKSIDDKLVEE